MQQMTEYWINVYTNPFYGDKCYYGNKNATLKLALSSANYNSKYAIVLYRIHVKMKLVEDKEIVVEEPWQVPPNLPVGTKVRITGPKFYNWRDIYS